MSPNAGVAEGQSSTPRKESSGGHREKERIGNYVVGAEIGRGSFATVYKGYRSVSESDLHPIPSLSSADVNMFPVAQLSPSLYQP